MAIDFTGATGAKVDIGNSSSLQITGAMTAMVWVNFNSDVQNCDLFSKYASADRGWTLQTDDDLPSNMWGIFLIAQTASLMKDSGWSTITLEPGVWYHLAGQFVPSTAVQIWVDGAMSKEKTTGIPATMYDPANNVIIGNRASGDQGADAKIADVRIYNRNLSAAEMSTIYASRGRDRIIHGLVSRLLMNEGPDGSSVAGAGSVVDCGASGNHGTPSGSNLYVASELRW